MMNDDKGAFPPLLLPSLAFGKTLAVRCSRASFDMPARMIVVCGGGGGVRRRTEIVGWPPVG